MGFTLCCCKTKKKSLTVVDTQEQERPGRPGSTQVLGLWDFKAEGKIPPEVVVLPVGAAAPQPCPAQRGARLPPGPCPPRSPFVDLGMLGTVRRGAPTAWGFLTVSALFVTHPRCKVRCQSPKRTDSPELAAHRSRTDPAPRARRVG